MTLTTEERNLRAAAELDRLLCALHGAMRQNDLQRFEDLRRRLEDFTTRMDVPSELRHRANQVIAQAGVGLTRAGLVEMARIVDQISSAGSGLEAAIGILDSGKKELLLPGLAAAAERALELAIILKDAADALDEDVGDVEGFEDLPEVIEQLVDAYNDIKDKLPRG